MDKVHISYERIYNTEKYVKIYPNEPLCRKKFLKKYFESTGQYDTFIANEEIARRGFEDYHPIASAKSSKGQAEINQIIEVMPKLHTMDFGGNVLISWHKKEVKLHVLGFLKNLHQSFLYVPSPTQHLTSWKVIPSFLNGIDSLQSQASNLNCSPSILYCICSLRMIDTNLFLFWEACMHALDGNNRRESTSNCSTIIFLYLS